MKTIKSIANRATNWLFAGIDSEEKACWVVVGMFTLAMLAWNFHHFF